jgi:hypothetical protein
MDLTLDKTAQTQHSCHEPQSSDADRALLFDILARPGDKEYRQMREWAGKMTNSPARHPFTEVRRRGLLRYAV